MWKAALTPIIILSLAVGCQNATPSIADSRQRTPTDDRPKQPPRLQHLNVAAFGYADDQHVDLAAALQSIQTGKKTTAQQVAENLKAGAIYLDYKSKATHYSHLVLPPEIPLAQLYRTLASLDGIVLVVSSGEAIDSRTESHLRMANAAGVSNVVVFAEADELSSRRRRELQELLTSAGFSGPLIVVGGGKDHATSIPNLIQVMDKGFVASRDDVNADFLMPIDDVFSIEGRGTIVTGMVDRGVVRTGDQVEVVGDGNRQATRVLDLEMFRGKLDSASAGDHTGVLLENVGPENVAAGYLLAKQGTLVLANRLEAEVRLQVRPEPDDPITMLAQSASLPVKINFEPPVNENDPLSSASVMLELRKGHGFEAGDSFVLLSRGAFAGVGVVRKAWTADE